MTGQSRGEEVSDIIRKHFPDDSLRTSFGEDAELLAEVSELFHVAIPIDLCLIFTRDDLIELLSDPDWVGDLESKS